MIWWVESYFTFKDVFLPLFTRIIWSTWTKTLACLMLIFIGNCYMNLWNNPQVTINLDLFVHISQLHFLVDYLPFGRRRRGFTPKASIFSAIKYRCVVLVFASSFPFIFAFYYLLWVVILIGLGCLPILFIAFVHFLHTSCLT